MRRIKNRDRIVYSVAYGTTGRELASLDSAGGICIHDLATFRVVRRLNPNQARPIDRIFRRHGLAFVRALGLIAPEGEWPIDCPYPSPWDARVAGVIAHSWDGLMHLAPSVRPLFTDLTVLDATGKRRINLERPVHDLCRLGDFSADGRLLAVLSIADAVRLFDPATGAAVGRLPQTEHVWDLEFSAAGPVLAVSAGKSVCLWDAGREEELARLESGPHEAQCVAFSPDGQYLAAGCQDWRVRLWEVRSARLLLDLDLECGPISRLVFSPDGSTLAAACGHGFTVVCDVDV